MDIKDLNVNLPTMVRTRYTKGMLLGVDGSMWLARKVPLLPIADARSSDKRAEAYGPLLAAYHELADLVPVIQERRTIARKNYRQTQLLLINTKNRFRADPKHPIADYLDASFAKTEVDKRILLILVRLKDKMGGTGSFKEVATSLAESLTQGHIPLSDYEWDYGRVDEALSRCGFSIPSNDEMVLADSWWNQGRFPDTIILPHAEHLHQFQDEAAAAIAKKMGKDDCSNWPYIPRHHITTFATVDGFDFDFARPTDDVANWMTGIVDSGISAVSIRALIEPPKVTRAELRRKQQTYINDMEERTKTNKLNRAEQGEQLETMRQIEDVYASGKGAPTLVEASVLIAFDGLVEEVTRSAKSGANVRPMSSRQKQALAEMMICSNVTANPATMDLPAQTIACAGMQSLSVVGDRTGALVGLTERDRQPAYLDPTRQSNEDTLPLSFNVGGTGSGKRLTLGTAVPTPGGWSTIGGLAVGDQVYGRDGSPCRVTSVSSVEFNPELYSVEFSDGQVLKADFEHQWVVEGPAQPADTTTASNLVRAAAASYGFTTLAGVLEAARQAAGKSVYPNELAVRAALAMVDIRPNSEGDVHLAGALAGLSMRVLQRMEGQKVLAPGEQVLSTGEMLAHGAERFRIRAAMPLADGKGFHLADTYRMGKSAAAGLPAAIEVVTDMIHHGGQAQRLNAFKGICDTLGAVDESWIVLNVPDHWNAQVIAELGRSLGLVVDEPYLENGSWCVSFDAFAAAFTDPKMQELSGNVLPPRQWLHLESIKSIASEPARCITVDSPDSTYLVEGLIPTHNTQVLLFKATQYAKMGYPSIIVDPKALRLSTRVVTPSGYSTIERLKVGDQVIGRSGYPCTVTQKSQVFTDTRVHRFAFEDGQHVVADAHHQWAAHHEDTDDYYPEITTERMLEIGGSWSLPVNEPVQYEVSGRSASGIGGVQVGFAAYDGRRLDVVQLRGPVHERRTILNGVFDICGTILGGDAVLALGPESDIDGITELVRSLGHKVRVRGRLLVFRTEHPLGSGSAACEPLRTEDRRLAIRSIDSVPSEPVQCIRVDSPDHTYLIEGFVTTHNTGSDHSPVVKAFGGTVYSLDELSKADGVFDPIRFAASPEVGAEIALNMLTSVYPWPADGSNYEVEAMQALAYGVSKGGDCIGRALTIAYQDGKARHELVAPIMSLAESSPLFRACVGLHPGGEGLRVADGLTLIMVGDNHLDLPAPGAVDRATMPQRVALALVRMMVFGSAMALTNRNGTIHLDEAWVFLGAGKDEIERLGRLARSQRVLPELYTQRVSDALDAGLEGYISRGFILPIEDKAEAIAACKLFNLEPTSERIGRITAKQVMGEGEDQTPNWNSMKALRDPETNKVLRGAIGIYCDLSGRAVPVEVVLPTEFLKKSSTNAKDIDERKKVAAGL